MDSYAYNPNNAGHLYINSSQLEADLKEVVEEMEKAEEETEACEE